MLILIIYVIILKYNFFLVYFCILKTTSYSFYKQLNWYIYIYIYIYIFLCISSTYIYVYVCLLEYSRCREESRAADRESVQAFQWCNINITHPVLERAKCVKKFFKITSKMPVSLELRNVMTVRSFARAGIRFFACAQNSEII